MNQSNVRAQSKAKPKRLRDGYVPRPELDKRIGYFLRGYGKRLSNQTDKIAYYCQTTAYNAYVEYYSEQGWVATVRQTKHSRFYYKLQPFGDPEKFSFFEVKRDAEKLWVLNNMQIESAHDQNLFVAPDVVVVRPRKIQAHRAVISRIGERLSLLGSFKRFELTTSRGLPFA